ncbi:uncharacterized protein LOC134718457 isoform X3 [Mytilus trossulus]|uniref:uncharacterized protein LOC134718457 isoform X3 n=1 Tax=Mytilus trossulus TaxID=6551 RepID=UPI0030068780
MSMNYVGSISLMDKGDYDRGDSPAQAVLDKNARSVAQRIADETREELEKVLERVEHIYDSYENSMELIFQTQHSANMEYVNDINELEEIMKDQIKKRKYQQGLTIFIVGYENVCGQRLKLLQNVNEFFMENSKSVEEEDWFPKTPDLDLDDAAENIDQSLNKAEDLANRLGEINQEMVNWLSNYAINKASSKALAFVDAKGKKKLEKALEKAKEDLGSLSEKLHNLQLDLEDKESKYQDLLKMLENKNLETQKYKTAAEIAKKNVTELEIENAVMKEDLEKRKNFMKDLQRKLNRAENELSQNDMLKDIQANQISDQYQETQSMEALTAKKKIQELQETVDKNKSKTEEVKREIEKFHETQIVAITQAHAAEVDAMKNEYEEELKKAKAESGEIQKKIDEAEQAAKTAEEEADSLRHNLIELQLRAASAETRNSELADLDEDPSRLNSQQDSRPSTKNSRQSSKGKPLPTKSPKRDGKSGKDLADTSMQDEGGDPNTAHVETRQSKKNKSSLEPLREGEVTEFTDQYDLKDNDAWATLPLEQMQSRYIQYRKLTKERLEELEDQLEVTVAKTQRKVNNLKHQFQEHKNKWESERKLLIDQVEQAQKLQTEAEKEADTAMGQLEEFINEQERLEDEEEGKRTDIVKAVTRPSRKKSPDEAGDRKSVSSDTQTQKEPEAAEPQSSTERPSEEHTEPELSRLLQQTDDAKSQRQNSESVSELDSDIAPWLKMSSEDTRNNTEVFDSPDLKMRSKQSYRSRSELRRPESERTPMERISSEPRNRIKSEQSDQIVSDVSHGNDFDEREEVNLDADVEIYTDDHKSSQEASVSQKSLKSRNSRNRSSMSRKSLSTRGSLNEVENLESKKSSRFSSEEAILKSGQKSRSSTKHGSNAKSRRSSLKGDDGRTNSSSLKVEEADGSKSRRSSLNPGEVERVTSGKSSVLPEGDQPIQSKSQRNSPLKEDVEKLPLIDSRRGSLVSRTSNITDIFPAEDSDEDIGDDFHRQVQSRGKSQILKRSRIVDDEPLSGRKTAPPYSKQVQEMNSRITGAMSAPPAVEDGVEVTDKKGLLRTRSGGSRSRSPRPGSSDKVENAQSLHPLSSAYAIEEISEGHSSNSGSPLSDGSRSNNSKSNPRSNTRSPHINTRSSPSQQDGGHSRSAWNTPRGETHLASRERSAKSDASSRKGTSPKYYQMSPDNFETPPRSADSIRKVALSRSEWLEEEEDEEEETPQQPYTSPVKSLPQQKPYTSPEVSVKTLPQNQAEALDNVNQMITHEKLSSYQTRALDSVRMALQQINEDQENLSNQQLERTLTMISLASQLTEESLHLGLLPDSIFDTFAVLNSRAMSDMSHGEDEYSLDDNMSAYNTGAEFLRPITKMSVENQNMTAFLQELSHHSLKSLPPLGGVLTSSQSQRPYIGEATFSSIDKYKPPSAPQRMVSYLDDRDTTFDTEATMGTMSRVNTLTSFLPKIKPDSRKHTKILRSRGVDVQTFDYHDMETQTSPPPEQQPQSVQTKPESPESVRESSALSRASLRSQYKAKLEETRQAVEERRSNTPAISIPSPRSLEEDQLIEDEDDDVALPDDFKDGRSREATMDVATSPPLDKRDSITRYSTKPDDPVIQEYLKTYDSIISFRDALSKILLDKEMLQASQVLTELETARFDRDDKLEPQVEMMTSNAYYLFEEIIAVLGSILYTEEREPVVSSMMISREGTKPMTREKSGDSLRGALRQSRVSSVASQGLDKGLLNELQDNYTKLQKQFEGESKKHEEQIRHNTVVMMEMQDTINELQRELGNLGRSASRIRQSSDLATPQGVAESAIMFTRLDSERNAKIMKRAVNDEKLDPDQYKDAVSKMEDYVSIPAKRLAHLVRKYVHHCRMKEIEENVKKSKSLDENVFEVLDKMENFQNKRAKQWADGMDHMGNDRLRFANILMETLENIEQQSGIFLIKPMYSFKGRDIKERYAGKLARPMRPQRNISPAREISSFAPAPTPASNIRGLTRGHVSSSLMQAPEEEVRPEPLRPLVGDDSGITGAGMVWVGSVPRSTWNIGSSQVRAIDDLQNPNMMNTPRILELDINRMMIGQNNISTRITSPGVSDDRLVNASQNNLRSYVTVNRPAPAPGQARPSTFSSVKDNVPPSSPTAHQYTPSPSVQKRVRMSDGDVGRAINSTPPLPPISGGSRGRHSPEETNISTASLQPQVLEVVSPLK